MVLNGSGSQISGSKKQWSLNVAVVKVKSVEVKSNGPLMAAVVKSVEVKGNGPLMVAVVKSVEVKSNVP
jgi:hypothetical protein